MITLKPIKPGTDVQYVCTIDLTDTNYSTIAGMEFAYNIKASKAANSPIVATCATGNGIVVADVDEKKIEITLSHTKTAQLKPNSSYFGELIAIVGELRLPILDTSFNTADAAFFQA